MRIGKKCKTFCAVNHRTVVYSGRMSIFEFQLNRCNKTNKANFPFEFSLNCPMCKILFRSRLSAWRTRICKNMKWFFINLIGFGPWQWENANKKCVVVVVVFHQTFEWRSIKMPILWFMYGSHTAFHCWNSKYRVIKIIIFAAFVDRHSVVILFTLNCKICSIGFIIGEGCEVGCFDYVACISSRRSRSAYFGNVQHTWNVFHVQIIPMLPQWYM